MAQKGDKVMPSRGYLNKNPCNIKRSTNNWLGLVKNSEKQDPVFCVFKSPEYGIRAACKLLLNYKRFYGISTIRTIIDRFAPASENCPEHYIEFICKRMGKGKDEVLDLYDPNVMEALLEAIIRFENGYAPYDSSIIRKGMSLAGVT